MLVVPAMGNGRVVNIQAVDDNDELMLITAKGMMLRTDLSAVREIGRATQGVRLIRLDEGDKVVATAKIVKEDEEESGDTEDGKGTDNPTPTDGKAIEAPPDEAEGEE